MGEIIGKHPENLIACVGKVEEGVKAGLNKGVTLEVTINLNRDLWMYFRDFFSTTPTVCKTCIFVCSFVVKQVFEHNSFNQFIKEIYDPRTTSTF